MLNTALFKILRSLDKEELGRFEDFISSPYYNKKKKSAQLFKVIRKSLPGPKEPITESNKKKLGFDHIWKTLYPGKRYNYGIMKNLIYDLKILAEKFLSAEKFKSDGFQSDFYLLEQYRERSLPAFFVQKHKNAELNAGKDQDYIENYYMNLFKLAAIKKEYEFFVAPKEIVLKDFFKPAEYLVYHFLVRLFSEYNSISTVRLIKNAADDFPFVETVLKNIELENIFKFLKESSIEDYRRILFSYKKYLALSNRDDPAFYFDFKNYVFENFNELSNPEKFNHVNTLSTALTGLNCDLSLKKREYVEIYKLRVKYDLIMSKEGFLSPVVYYNIIKNAAHLKDHEFLESFIKKYFNMLPEEYKLNMNSFSIANLHYAKEEYHKALEYVSRTEFEVFALKRLLKSLHLILLFEINDYEGYINIRDNYRRFLLNNKRVNPLDREIDINFIKYTDQLFKLKENRDPEELSLYEKNLLDDRKVSQKDWLMEKISELKAAVP